MSNESLRTAGILLVIFPTVVFGGASLLWHWITRQTSYYDHPLRRSLWRAGHAHAGVLLILSLVAVDLVDHADLTSGWKQLVRTTIPAGALLVPMRSSFRSLDLTQSVPTGSSTSRTSLRSASRRERSFSASACCEPPEPGRPAMHRRRVCIRCRPT